MENRKEMRWNFLQTLLFSVVTGLASTISANASNDSIKAMATQKEISATADAFDKLYSNPDKPFELVDSIGPNHPIKSGDPFLPIHPDKSAVPNPPVSTSSTYDVGSPKGVLNWIPKHLHKSGSN